MIDEYSYVGIQRNNSNTNRSPRKSDENSPKSANKDATNTNKQSENSNNNHNLCKVRWRRFDSFGDIYQRIVDSAAEVTPQSVLRSINTHEKHLKTGSSAPTASQSLSNLMTVADGKNKDGNETKASETTINNRNDSKATITPNILLNQEISQLKAENQIKNAKIEKLSKVNLDLRTKFKVLDLHYQKQFENYKSKMDTQCNQFRDSYKVNLI